jgi:hypothetical protein
MNNFIRTGSIHIQGASGHSMITLLPETIADMREFQVTYANVNVTVLINDAIRQALIDKEQDMKALEIVGEELANERVHNNSRGSIQ